MANIKSKIKNIKKIEKATIRNRAIKSSVRTAIKKAKLAITSNDAKVKDLIAVAHKEINTAVSKGTLHKNNGARKMARLDAFQAKQTSK